MNKKETIGSWIAGQILKEQTEIKTVVAIYPGRFQPMGAHHAKAFKSIPFKDKFIATSNKVALPKSPFSFAEKKKIISAYGLGSSLKQVKNPYKAEEILKRYDPETTAAIFVVGKKDAQRLGGKFFRPWKGKAEIGYRDGAYTYIAPHVSMNVAGYGEMSGTTLRTVLGDKNLESSNKKKIFTSIFGRSNLKNYDWIVKKLESLNESVIEQFIVENDISKIISEASTTGISKFTEVDDGPSHGFGSLDSYKKVQKKLAEKLGWMVVNHLLDLGTGYDVTSRDAIPTPEDHIGDTAYPRGPVTAVSYFPAGDQGVLTPNNQVDMSQSAAYRKWKKHIKVIATNVGMQLINWSDSEPAKTKKNIQGDRIKEPNKPDKAITKMVKKIAKLNKPSSQDKKASKNLRDLSITEAVKQLINEGGAYGHMSHPFDDKGLRFGDFKQIINNALQGHLDLESSATEKTDGQNLFITWNKKLLAARNTGDLKRGGMDAKAVKLKFANRGNIEKAFNYAMRDLAKAIGGLSDKQKEKIFDGGNNWVNMEIMYPASANVIVYDAPYLQFHNVLKYKDGSATGSVIDGARILAGMIAQTNQNMQKSFSIIGPKVLKVNPHQDFGVKRPYFIGKLSKLMSRYKMKDSNTFGEYHQAWWESFVDKKFKGIDNKTKMGLVKRWAFFDKSFRLDKKNIPDSKMLDTAKGFDKMNHADQVKKNMFPFETLFFELGAEVLKNVEGFLAANPDKAVQSVRRQVAKAISDVRKGGDLKKLNRMHAQLAKVQAIGGFKTIIPSEGLVFVYKGNTYKLTGAFAPVNQITGMMAF